MGLEQLNRTARTLGRRRGRAKALPGLWAFTDPARTPDPQTILRALPRGAALVYRAFGAADAEQTARRLLKLARARGVLLMIGADAALARRIGADGVHLPERAMTASRRLGPRGRGFLVTAAAHSPRALAAARALPLDAVVYSAIFPSRSASAGAPLGPVRLAALARSSRKPIIALGGVDAVTARRLASLPLAGLAAVDAFLKP